MMRAMPSTRFDAGVDGGLPEDLAIAALTLARRFAGGATMWCVADQWPAHGHHVAVEFVHPVVVGKRALPAVHLDRQVLDVGAALRLLGRPGDVLLTVSTADHQPTVDLLQRAPAWGLTRVWVGAGRRPSPGHADHVVWAETGQSDAGTLPWSGAVVILYHLLWELTHVVFEHPGLLTDDRDPELAVCTTCADTGEVAEITAVLDGARAEVLLAGRRQVVDVSLVESVAPGRLVLVHAGVAIDGLGDRP